MTNIVPEVINQFNIYNEGNKLIGVSGEVELPDIETMTDTLEGCGVMGTMDDPVTGQFSSMKVKIPFAMLYEDYFKLMDTTKPPQLTLRGAMQCIDSSTGATGYYPIKIVFKGKAATSTLGKVAKAQKNESALELELFYYKVMINGKDVLEIDKLNFKFVLNGKDMMAKIRSMC